MREAQRRAGRAAVVISRLGRRLRVYFAMAAMAPKLHAAYRAWFWMSQVVQVLALTVFVFFWRAVYASQDTLGGLTLDQTLDYILLAQVLFPVLARTFFVFHIGRLLVEGHFVMEMLRPLDLQGRYFAEAAGFFLVELVLQVPLAVFAWAVFGLSFPSDPAIWAAFAVSLCLGRAVMFLFDWLFCCLAFTTTESWGLSVVLHAVTTFFSGFLIPLDMMPAWLRSVCYALPFAQGLYVPVSLLARITPVAEAPSLWLVQGLWVAGLLVASRGLFSVAARRITVQGG